jgi:hypothetical protein
MSSKKYTVVQAREALRLSEELGSVVASERMGIPRSSFFRLLREARQVEQQPVSTLGRVVAERALVQQIRSRALVLHHRRDGPWELGRKEEQQLIEGVPEGGPLPLPTAPNSHLQPPEVDCVAPQADVLPGIVLGA